MFKKGNVRQCEKRNAFLRALMLSLITTVILYAATATAQGGAEQELGALATLLQTWMSGELGMLILMVGLLVAVIMVVARASLLPVLFVLGLAIILGWGPTIFGAILTSAGGGGT